jgi:putative PIN family toxin of toxin-antitoxin system
MGGGVGRLVDRIKDLGYRLVTSEPLLKELADVLGRPKIQRRVRLTERQIARALRALRRVAKVVPGRYEVDLVPTDVKDNPVVACALEGQADYIVTEDADDLLPLKAIRVSGYRVIQIVRPEDFIEHLLAARRLRAGPRPRGRRHPPP